MLVKLRVEDSEEALFVLDTGCPTTVISKSLEPKLGKPVGHQRIHFPWYPNGKSVATKYAWPKLYLANTELSPGRFVLVADIMNRGPRGSRYAGILGMDCLQHYCIQLDFDERTIRFLKPEDLNTNDLGRAFPLAYVHSSIPFGIRSEDPQYPFPLNLRGNLVTKTDLFGRPEWCLVDTGDYGDGSLSKKRLQEAAKLQPRPIVSTVRTNGSMIIQGALLPAYSVGGQEYTNVVVISRQDADENVLGLRLLARNLVTFDFLNRTMYLKQRHTGGLAIYGKGEKEAFQAFIKNQKTNGGLPGLPRDADGTLVAELGHEPGTYSFRPTGKQSEDGSTKYYQFKRADGEGDPWILQRAWRMDQNNKLLEEYPVP